MSDKTSIEWTDATWNPIRGCTRVSEGCRNCYAERIAARFSDKGRPYHGLATRTSAGPRWTGKVITVPDHLEDPIRWKEPRMIFVNSMSDLFHEDLSFSEIRRVFDVMRRAPQHTYQILTKRSDRMLKFFNIHLAERAPANWWLGVSVEDQRNADCRIPELLQTWASVRWISAEPLLGPIELTCLGHEGDGVIDSLRGEDWIERWDNADGTERTRQVVNRREQLDWVVVGGESGPGARPMHPIWVRELRDQCTAAGVPFFFKQWGEWVPHTERFGGGLFLKPDGSLGCQGDYWEHRAAAMNRVGKKKAGRILDGREWNEYPASLSSAGEKRIVEAACS